MEAAPPPGDFIVLSLLRCGEHQPRIPFDGCGHAATVFEVNRELVLVDLCIHDASHLVAVDSVRIHTPSERTATQ
jgi:hypothetical protein